MDEQMECVTADQSNDSVSRFDQSGSSDTNLSVDLSASGEFSSFKGDTSNAAGDSSDEDSYTNGVYYFESDHLALKGNTDYQAMLRVISMLEAQRIQAVKDLDQMYEARTKALAEPIEFVAKLQQGVQLDLPKPQKVVSLPLINWEKYTSNLDFSTLGIHKHMTRLKRQLVDGTTDDTGTSGSVCGGTTNEDEDSDQNLVRGRMRVDTKPNTFNQLWTVEEQKRLEELLVEHPPEEVEAKRWQKIATAIGNRTPIQVASRIQKYFIKLAKAGLPIPGRRPNVNINAKKISHKHHRYHKFYYQPSTFMQSYEPPVYMSDEDSDSQGCMESVDSQYDLQNDEVSDDEEVSAELRNTSEYQELLQLKRLRLEKLKSQSRAPAEHVGFKCDNCQTEPIVGTRWHCLDCPTDLAVDFCDDCVDCLYETENHNSTHRLKPIKKAGAASYVDQDYMSFMPGGYNYLDPNYMPAS